jgi:hypothetical protein
MKELASIGMDQVFGEMLHIRGCSNIAKLKELLGEELAISREMDKWLGNLFEALLSKYGLKGKYWYEYY